MSGWRPKGEAKPDGTICQLRLKDSDGGEFDSVAKYIFGRDGKWYRVNNPIAIDEFYILQWRDALE